VTGASSLSVFMKRCEKTKVVPEEGGFGDKSPGVCITSDLEYDNS
jgi:hypothetical protein